MLVSIPKVLGMLTKTSESTLFKPEFFETRYIPTVDKYVKAVKPVLVVDGVHLGYTVGPRMNGIDEAVWPEDLTVDVVV